MKNMFLVFFVLLAAPLVSHAQTTTHNSRLCSLPKKTGLASCNAIIVSDSHNKPLLSNSPTAYGPQQIRSAYSLSGKTSGKQTVAIVDAYDDPTIKQDLDTYSEQFGLPKLPTCSSTPVKSSVPCFSKINQHGTSALPKVNGSWSMEIALDVEAVHATCENCSIVLVEATSPNMKNLLQGVDTAVAQGATVVSNSWGGAEFAGETNFDSHFNKKGVAFTVSAGDSGYGVQYPAASPYVTAVGGTSLYVTSTNNYKDENAWSGTGSGCSQFEAKPSWQTDTKCAGRTVADVSAAADPATGFAVYSSTTQKGQKGWFTAGGTSLAAPLVAAVYALSGNIPANEPANSLPYLLGSKSNLHDVVGGSNGDCSPTYLCAGKTKYDGPTGLGSPKGVGAF